MDLPEIAQSDADSADNAARIFTGPITLAVPTAAERFDYKKKGSSDTAHTKDVIIT